MENGSNGYYSEKLRTLNQFHSLFLHYIKILFCFFSILDNHLSISKNSKCRRGKRGVRIKTPQCKRIVEQLHAAFRLMGCQSKTYKISPTWHLWCKLKKTDNFFMVLALEEIDSLKGLIFLRIHFELIVIKGPTYTRGIVAIPLYAHRIQAHIKTTFNADSFVSMTTI